MTKTGPKPRTIEQIIQVLEDKSFLNEIGCFIWTGHTAGEGYGTICYNAKQVYIHRLIYSYYHDEEPNVIRHSCDNPACWNIDHLSNGTHADNVADKVDKKRHCFGENHYRSMLTEDKIREIRSSDLPPADLARKYNIHRAAIHDIINGITWKHVS